MSHVLMLNADGQPLSMLPLSVITWKEAMRLMFLEKVNVVEEYEDWKVHSATMSFNVPSIIMAKNYIRRKTHVRLTRGNLYLRDQYICGYCNQMFEWEQLTYDHVKPTSKGGEHTWENLVTACQMCNSRKGDKKIKPNKECYEPTYWDLVNKRMNVPVIIRHYSWKRFITAGDGGFKLLGPHDEE